MNAPGHSGIRRIARGCQALQSGIGRPGMRTKTRLPVRLGTSPACKVTEAPAAPGVGPGHLQRANRRLQLRPTPAALIACRAPGIGRRGRQILFHQCNHHYIFAVQTVCLAGLAPWMRRRGLPPATSSARIAAAPGRGSAKPVGSKQSATSKSCPGPAHGQSAIPGPSPCRH